MGDVGFAEVADYANTSAAAAVGVIGVESIGSGVSAPMVSAAWSPVALFADRTIPGAWYDPSDIPVNWRRNLLTYTEQFDNAIWVKGNASVSQNAETAPDGTTTADKLIENSATSTHQIYQNYQSPIVQNITFSVYAKAAERNVIALLEPNGTERTFNLSTGVATGSGASMVNAGNGWWRCVASGQAIDTANRSYAVRLSNGSTTNYAGDGTSGAFIWGAQLEVGSTASVYQQIVTPEISFLQYQPQPVLYTDSAGTTPVTAVEQAVGLALDKSRGLVLGPQLVTNAGPFADTSGWTGTDATLAASSGQLEATNTAAAAGYAISSSFATTAGRMYRVQYSARRGTSSSIDIQAARADTGNSLGGVTLTSTSLVSGEFVFFAATATTVVRLVNNQAVAGRTGYLASISVRELSGTHLIQPTSASRPVLRSRYNLLTYSEQFDNAAWTKSEGTVTANAETAPDGTLTAEKLIPAASTTNGRVVQIVTGVAGFTYTLSCYAKAGEFFNFRIYVDGGSGANIVSVSYNLSTDAVITALNVVGGNWTGASTTITDVGNGWRRVTLTFTATAVAPDRVAFWCRNTGDGTSGIFIWGADLRRANDTYLPYQRIAAATDYDTVGFPVYLAFDGSDDSLYTGGNLDLSGTDKVTVFAGVTKLSDAAVATLAELSASINTNAFDLQAPSGAATPTYRIRSAGTSLSSVTVNNAAYAAPVTNVITATSNISGDSVILRADGVQVGSSTADQGTGNFDSQPLYVGRRNNASLPFNGREYEMIIVGRTCTATEITRTENFIANAQGRNL